MYLPLSHSEINTEQLTSSQLPSNVGLSNDPVNIWRVKERQQSEGGGGQERVGVKESEETVMGGKWSLGGGGGLYLH